MRLHPVTLIECSIGYTPACCGKVLCLLQVYPKLGSCFIIEMEKPHC